MNNFLTPPNHVNFSAKKLFNDVGEIIDGSIAYLYQQGGGPATNHTHEHSHLFIVIQGEAKIISGSEIVIIKENESYLMEGTIPHSVWNNIAGVTIMVGISVKPKK